jgi:Amt family ammonium transporter
MGIAVIFLWTFVTAGIVWMFLKVTIGIRISEAEEEAGADATDIGIEAYPEFTR